MSPTITLSAVSDALKMLASLGRLAPVAGEAVAGALEMALQICEIAQNIKDNKRVVQQLALDAGLSLVEITKIIQGADQAKWEEYEGHVSELYEVLREIKNVAGDLANQSVWNRVLNRNKFKDTILDLEGKLSRACTRFGIHQTLRNTISLGVLEQMTASIINTQKKTLAAVENTNTIALLDKLNPVPASWNSDAVQASIACCLAETRVQILDDIATWAHSEPGAFSPSVFWLSGLAGTGKSTIPRTLCEGLAAQSVVCASFFFSRQSGERRDPSRVACSLAYQLALSDDNLRSTICSAIQENPDVASRSISDQIRLLLADPLSQCAALSCPIVLVLDALDECDKRDGKEGGLMLHLLVTSIRRLNVSCSVRLFVTSRGEPSIQAMFDELNRDAPNAVVRLHEIEHSIVQHDIVRYLENKLRAIPSRLPDIVPSGWPGQADLDALAARAGVLFVYAATLVRYIDSELDDPMDLLRSVLDGTVADSEGVYEVVDQLYSQILDRAVRSQVNAEHAHCRRLRDVVGSLILLRTPLCTASLARLICAKAVDVNLLLRQLSAILIMSESTPVTVFHPSFPDFITERDRCKDDRFYVDSRSHHATLALRCLLLMNTHLTRDICGIKDPSLLNSEVADLPDRLCVAVPPELAYACHYWAAHVSSSHRDDSSFHLELLTFCRTKLLYWVEVLSLMGILHLSYGIVDSAKKYCDQGHDRPLNDAVALLNDVNYMIREFYPAIRDSALHVYYSAVPMMPQCRLFELYFHEAQSSVRLLSERRDGWQEELLHTFRSVAATPDLLVFLPGNTHLLCTTTDLSMRRRWTMEIWDVTTGESVRTSEELEPGSNQRVAVSLSPDGTRLLSTRSGSHPRIWSTATGQAILELREPDTAPLTLRHMHTCNAFSSDGRHVAVCADAHSIQLWDAYTGALEVSLPGDHSLLIDRLFISYDCISLICVFEYHSLRIWDIKTASVIAEIQLIYPLHFQGLLMSPSTQYIGALVHEGDIDRDDYGRLKYKVWSTNGVLEREVPIDGDLHETQLNPRNLVFSPNGKMILSMDNLYQPSLWDLDTGAHIGTLQLPENKHDWTSINISDDGSTVVAGSYHGTLCAWNTQTRMVIAQFIGHGQTAKHVSVSPDCSLLASYSLDGTVRLWDVSHSHISRAVPGQGETLVLVSVFDDGDRIVSVSEEGVVTVWNTQSGRPIVTMEHPQLEEIPKKISCVAVSADGSHVIGGFKGYSALCPGNRFACVWDSATGKCVAHLVTLGDDIASVSLSQDGSLAALVVGDDDLHIWNVRAEKVVSQIRIPLAQNSSRRRPPPRSVVLSPDGLHAATYFRWHDQSVQLFDVTSQLAVILHFPIPDSSWVKHLQLKYLRDGTLCAFVVNTTHNALHAWDKDDNYKAIAGQLPVMYMSDPDEASYWIWRVLNGDPATSRRVCWVPPERHRNLWPRSRDSNSPGHIMAFGSTGGCLTILDFANVSNKMTLSQ